MYFVILRDSIMFLTPHWAHINSLICHPFRPLDLMTHLLPSTLSMLVTGMACNFVEVKQQEVATQLWCWMWLVV